MKENQRLIQKFAAVFLVLFFMFGCEKEFSSIGSEIINDNPFATGSVIAPVFVSHKKLPPTQSNGLPVYMLGVYDDPVFGRTESSIISTLSLSTGVVFPLTFGSKSSDEDETVTEVFLEIPFFTNRNDQDNDGVIDIYDVDKASPESDSDGDTISDLTETQNGTDPLKKDTDGDGIDDNLDDNTINPNKDAFLYDLDSIFGNQEASFTLKVQELDYYLTPFDPSQNFETYQYYYSDNTLFENYAGEVLFEDSYTIDDKEILTYKDDDPNTADVDESEQVETRIAPRLRIPLKNSFFQEKLLDKEGFNELSSELAFKDYLKGLTLSISDFSEPILMLLNLASSQIEVKYSYKIYDNNTVKDTLNTSFKMSLSGTLVNSVDHDPYPTDVQNTISQTDNPAQIYLKGGAGVVAEIDLFEGEEGQQILEEFKNSDRLINEANLTFYVDQQTLSSLGGTIEPDRLYLYNAETKQPLADYGTDMTTKSNSGVDKATHGGYLEYDDKLGVRYKIRITEHIKNIFRKDSTNVTLGLSVTSSISNPTIIRLLSDPQEFTPTANAINPFGTVLIGPNPAPENDEKKLQLEIYYTDPNFN